VTFYLIDFFRSFSQHDTSQHQSRLTAAHKIKRSLSHRRKLVNKLPLIKKEIEIESNVKQNTERLIQSIIDCNLANLKKALDNGIFFKLKITLQEYIEIVLDIFIL